MHTPTRRTLLGATLAAAGSGILAACSEPDTHTKTNGHNGSTFVPHGPKGYINPSDPEVIATEKARGTGPLRTFALTATETTIDLGGPTIKTWAYGDTLPGKEIRLTAGDTLNLTLANHLPAPTTLHSHGIRMRCDMDGVPGLTQHSIKPGADFTYRFHITHPGTYWIHSHFGMQLDRGLYAPLIIEDPKEPLTYDKEWTIILDDWVDGIDTSTPDAVLAQLQNGKHTPMNMNMDMGENTAPHNPNHKTHPTPNKPTGPNRILHGPPSPLLHSPGGHVNYPHYLINGRLPHAPTTYHARPGDRIRLRIINAGADTAFRLALGDHEMTITHTDGYPVHHTKTDALLIGMAERYDVLITAKDGVFPLTALAEGKNAKALAILRTNTSKNLPNPTTHPKELNRRTIPARRLTPHESVALPHHQPDRELRIRLNGSMKKFDWNFDHRPYTITQRHPIHQGERIRLTLINATSMWHPLHLHGHTFALTGINSTGARKDTALVLPHHKLVIDFDADNPGLWMLHCHNQYHSETGMMTILGYRR
ncbi:multicopper oxidase family protein [Streptomyces avermitilis]